MSTKYETEALRDESSLAIKQLTDRKADAIQDVGAVKQRIRRQLRDAEAAAYQAERAFVLGTGGFAALFNARASVKLLSETSAEINALEEEFFSETPSKIDALEAELSS